VRRVALAGGRCVIADLPSSEGAQVAADLNKETGSENVLFMPVDVRDEVQVSAALDAADKWGGINVGVNCAGICPAIKTLGRKGEFDAVYLCTWA
jgi:NAD(P)-dependent dehydrogenase (short-subunit alcohol dehydrogenase family)